MDLSRRELIRLGGLQAAMLSMPVFASETPQAKLLRFVAPIPLSGGWIRAAVQRLADGLEQDSLIEDKFGANGLIAMRYVLEQPANRPTFLISTNSTSTLNFITRKELGVERRAHFKAAGLLYTVPMVLITRKGLPDSLSAFVDYGQSFPGKLNYASPGLAGLPHLTTLMLQIFFGLKAQHVPQNGSSIVQVLGGHVDFAFVTLDSVLSHVGSGNLNIVAVSSKERVKILPHTPTLAELNQEFVSEGFVALLAGINTPPESVQRLNKKLNEMLASQDWGDAVLRHGVSLVSPHSSSFAEAWLDKDHQRWRQVWNQLGGEKGVLA